MVGCEHATTRPARRPARSSAALQGVPEARRGLDGRCCLGREPAVTPHCSFSKKQKAGAEGEADVELPAPVGVGGIAFILEQARVAPSLRRRSGRHDPGGRWRRRTNRIRHEHPLVAGESACTGCTPRNPVADLVDFRLEQLRAWRDTSFGEGRARIALRRRAAAATAAPAQHEEARRPLGRSLARPGSRPATGSTARQTSWRVLDSRRRRPLRP
jgi:hypothetical protein